MAFQKVNGLSRDGIVGPRTRAALTTVGIVLEELEHDLREQGWQLTGQGEYWWSKVFARQPPGVPP